MALALGGSQATTLTAATSIDNGYEIFISTDDSVAGTLFGSGENWPTTFTDVSPNLTAGVTNYLHIRAYDLGGIAMLIGQFSLSDSNFEFFNGTQTMLTGDAGLQVSVTGFGSGYSATTDQGPDGTSPWGFRPGIDNSARFVWSSDPDGDDEVYFSAVINATTVPEPAALALFGLGLLGLGLMRLGRAA
jgi:MSHA biogenesis protein MshQ